MVEDRLMNHLLAGELFTKNKSDAHYIFHIFSICFGPPHGGGSAHDLYASS